MSKKIISHKDDFADYLLNTLRIFNNAVHKAQQRNREMGIPNVYSRNGHLYYELPDGTITTEDPFE
jgi:hypothetical protein